MSTIMEEIMTKKGQGGQEKNEMENDVKEQNEQEKSGLSAGGSSVGGSSELSVADYIALKKEEYYQNNNTTSDDGWHQLRSQINSGLYLKLSRECINLYAKAELNYEQREILKFYLYANAEMIDEAVILKAMKCEAPEMLMYLYSTQNENNLISAVSENVSMLTDNISKYREDIKGLSAGIDAKMADYREKIAKYERELQSKDQIIKEKTEAYHKLLNENKRRAADEEKKMTFDREVLAAANKLFAEKMLEEELKKTKEKELEDKIRSEYEAKYPKTGRKGFFGRRDKTLKKSGIKKNERAHSYIVEELSPDFDITTYILNSSLSSSQYNIITLAVKMQIDESIIKQMIDNNLPAEQMKQLLSIILVKRENEKRTDSAAASAVNASTAADNNFDEDYGELCYEDEEEI